MNGNRRAHHKAKHWRAFHPGERVHLNFEIKIGDDPIKALWGSVLRQALQDIVYPGAYGRSATVWIASRRVAPCSFTWVCDVLDLNPDIIRKHIGVEEEPPTVN